MMRLIRSAAAMLMVAAAWAATPRPALPPGALAPNVHIFYYPWYGSPAVDGGYRHWQQGGRTPPQDGAAAETAYLDRTRYRADRFNPTPGGAGTGFRAVANSRFVTAGSSPLIASAAGFGTAEGFDVVGAGGGQAALRARVNGRYVAAENAGAAPLIANRTAIGSWERFTMVRDPDGTVSLRAGVNNRYVAAENAGAAPLVASWTSVGPWEKFNLVTS